MVLSERVGILEEADRNTKEDIHVLRNQMSVVHDYVVAQQAMAAYRKPWVNFVVRLIIPLATGALGGTIATLF